MTGDPGSNPCLWVRWVDLRDRLWWEGNQFKLDETMGSAALLVGRRTYEGLAAAWLSATRSSPTSQNTMPSTVLSGGMVDEVTKLNKEQDGDIVVYGSAISRSR
jgi:dihydrofolate reductase